MRKLRKSTISAVLLSVSIGLSLGCSRRPSDETLTQDIQKKVAADPDTDNSQVTVTAKDGKVTLSGKVSTPAAQQKIEEIARAESGVAGVDDQTTIEPEAMAATPNAAAPPPPVETPKPQPIVLPAGTVLTVKTQQALSSKSSQAGQTFLATLAQPVSVDGKAGHTCWIDRQRHRGDSQGQRQGKRWQLGMRRYSSLLTTTPELTDGMRSAAALLH